MPSTTGRWKLGLVLAVLTAGLWGILPIALKVVLEGVDPFTTTWYRFAFSGLVLGAFLAAAGRLPNLGSLSRRSWLLLTVGLAGLAGNYLLYIVALSRTTPTLTQTVSQLGPMFLLLGGLLIFKERFSIFQWVGFAILVAGLGLFFNTRLAELLHPSSGIGYGVSLLFLAAIIWAAYGLAQKRLLNTLSPQQILLLLYLGSVVVIYPSASPTSIRHASGLQLVMLAFCAVNTLVAYGAFAEGLKHWEVSRFGAVLSTAPLFTVVGMWAVERLVPGLVVPEHLNVWSTAGTLLVVAGSATCALARE